MYLESINVRSAEGRDDNNGIEHPLRLPLTGRGSEPPSPEHKACRRKSAKHREKQLSSHYRMDVWTSHSRCFTNLQNPCLDRGAISSTRWPDTMTVDAAEDTAARAELCIGLLDFFSES